MIIHMHIMMIGVGQGGVGRGRGRGGAGASSRQMRPKGIYCLRQSGWGGWAFLVSSGTIYIYIFPSSYISLKVLTSYFL